MTREQVYGRRPVREALRGPREVLELWATERAVKSEPWLRETKQPRVQVKLDKDVSEAAGTRDHQGVLVWCEPFTYAERLPADLHGRQCYVLDPMLATGGTLIAAIDLLFARGATDVTALALLAAPEGLARLEEHFGGLDLDVTVVTAALDARLNEKGYIVPGLGDAGDRLYGVV